MPLRRLACGAAAILALGATPALGQQPEAPRERTGPQAQPNPLPTYPVAPRPLVPRAAPGAPASVASGSLDEVRVTQLGDGDARPPRGWRPPGGAIGVRLDHLEGEALDAAWVRRQFKLNGVAEAAAVSRALALVQAINRAYLSAGFINSGVIVRPTPTPGVLDLGVVFGGLAPASDGGAALTVRWTGEAKGLDEGFVRDRMPSAFGRPLSAVALERDFRLLAEDPAVRTVNAELQPGTRPGEARLAVTVLPQDRYDLYVRLANTRSPSIGGERVSVGGLVRNALAAGDVLSGEVGVTKGLEDANVGYYRPFLSPRNTLSLRVALNNASVIDRPLQPLDIRARERSLELGFTRKFIDRPLTPRDGERWRPAQTLSGGLLVTRRVSKSFLLDQPFSFTAGSVAGQSDYWAARLVGDYLVRNVAQVFALSLTGTVGLDGSGTDVAGVAPPRSQFLSLLAQVNYARRLTAKGLEVRARLSGQLANSTLYAGERFAAGGQNSVRGYRENLLLADEGVTGSFEVAQPFSLSGRDGRGAAFDWGAFSGSAFVDAASLRNRKPPQPGRDLLAIGASLGWQPSEALFARITYAKALRHAPKVAERDIQDRGVSFMVTVRPLRWRK